MPNRILACLTDTSKIKTRSWLALLTMACFPLGSYSQEVAIKSNVVSDALLSPNIGIEFGLSGQAESTVHMLNWAIRSVKFLGVEFDQSEDEEVSVSDTTHL